MICIFRSWLSTCLLVSVGVFTVETLASNARAAATATTDLGQAVITPLSQQPNAPSSWQTVYEYAGGEVPPGTRIAVVGKTTDPVVRKDKDGVTFVFPDLPDEPQAAQSLQTRFCVEQPLANYPTRLTVTFTSHYQPPADAMVRWNALWFDISSLGYFEMFHLPAADPKAPFSLNMTGQNTVVYSFDGTGGTSVNVNGTDVSSYYANLIHLRKSGALLVPGISIGCGMNQFASDKGDWYTINHVQIEQMRPSLDVSSAAAIDLTIKGTEPVRTSLEVVDSSNDSQGFVLQDSMVAPGKYRLYWTGVNIKQTMPQNAVMALPGSYSFRLTTSKVTIAYMGEPSNSVPKYNAQSYGLMTATALAITPPGTPNPGRLLGGWQHNGRPDTRNIDLTDSVQMTGVGYDAYWNNWVGADGTLIHGKLGNDRMQGARGLAIAPPDPSGDPQKQFIYASSSLGLANSIVSCSYPDRVDRVASRVFSSPDWNRPNGQFISYKLQIGKRQAMLSPQQFFFFPSMLVGDDGKTPSHFDWTFRNIRLYEEGTPDPGPMTFDQTKFTQRLRVGSNRAQVPPVPDGTVMVEDSGHSIHIKNAPPVNYPISYTVTPHTVLAFDLEITDRTNTNHWGAYGIGLDTSDCSPIHENGECLFNFLGSYATGGGGAVGTGFSDPSIGAFPYPTFQPNTLYTETLSPPPEGAPIGTITHIFWQPGYNGLKISDDGKLLFACNNADHRLEVRDISPTGDGGAIAKIPIDFPMYLTWAPEGTEGAEKGSRYIYVDSPKVGLVKILWHLADNTFGKPEAVTPASEFAYPRGLVYNATFDRIFLCDAFTFDRSKVANQIVVIDPKSGAVLSRFGKKGGVNPEIGGDIDDETFTGPLNIDADSKGKLWVSDYYLNEARKYTYDPATGNFQVERRVRGPNTTNTSYFQWVPGHVDEGWEPSDQDFVRVKTDIGPDGRYTNPRTTSSVTQIIPVPLRPYSHWSVINGHIYATFASEGSIWELMGDHWAHRFDFGNKAGQAARRAGLLAKPGDPPTDLDKAIAASGDAKWEQRLWVWSDLNGDGKMQYTSDNPEFQIAFNSNLPSPADGWSENGLPSSGMLRESDGAYIYPVDIWGNMPIDKRTNFLYVIPPKTLNGKTAYDWADAKQIPLAAGEPAKDVLAQDGQFYVMRNSEQRHNFTSLTINDIEAYDEAGKLLWTRGRSDISDMTVQSLGAGLFATIDITSGYAGYTVTVRTKDGDLVAYILPHEGVDCWDPGTLRVDPDTALICEGQASKLSGLTTIKTDAATLDLSIPALPVPAPLPTANP